MRLSVPRHRVFRRVITVTDEETDENYRLADGEKIVFGVKKVPGKKMPCIIRKELTEADYDENIGGYVLILTSEDTDLPEGLYFYDAVLKKDDGQLEPIIKTSELEILPSVV